MKILLSIIIVKKIKKTFILVWTFWLSKRFCYFKNWFLIFHFFKNYFINIFLLFNLILH